MSLADRDSAVLPSGEDALRALLESCLGRQRSAYHAAPVPTLAARQHDLAQLARLLKENRSALVDAINRDYGQRAEFETLFAEVLVALDDLRHTRRHLRRWMRPQRRAVDILLYPLARNRVIPQPLGVVGVIVPWNFPLLLSIGPLVAIFAAGNRAMVKMSEYSHHLAELLHVLSPRYFPAEKLQFFVDDGSGRLGPAFSALPFDHLFFTGSAATGRAVMVQAARNLTPVTLELGGKSPAIIAPDFPLQTAAERILWVKLLNAGQICTTVDYLYLTEDRVEAFVDHARRLVAARYPTPVSATATALDNQDYTAIISPFAWQRLVDMLEDARRKGARVIELMPGTRPDAHTRKFPPCLVLGVTQDMRLMQEEIFGPILPIKTYRTPQDIVCELQGRDRPLALYPFTHDRALQQFYLARLPSGGVSINETLLHVAQQDLPFGGIGASGMGQYHGHEGFLTFSQLCPVFYQGPLSPIQWLFQPPYGRRARVLLEWLLKLKG